MADFTNNQTNESAGGLQGTMLKLRDTMDEWSLKIKKFLIKIHFDKWKGWVYLAPCIVLLLVFTGWPIINTLRMAFLEGYDTMAELGGEPFEFGIGNFVKVIQYRGFKDCLVNTMLLCVLTVPISTLLALLIAVCLNSIGPLSRMLQTIYFLPYVTNSIAIGMVFAAMFNMITMNSMTLLIIPAVSTSWLQIGRAHV